MPAPRARTLATSAVVLSLALALGGCDADDGTDAADVVEDADSVVVAEEDEDTTVVVDDLDGTVVVEGSDEAAAALDEAVDATRGREGRVAFSASAASPAATDGVIGEAVIGDGGATQVTMTIRGELPAVYGATDAEVEVRVIDDLAYVQWPAFLASADVDASWLRAPIDDGSSDVGDLVTRARLGSPGEALALVDDATAVAALDDTEFIAGEATTHYVATVPLGRALEIAGVGADLFVGAERDRVLEVHAYVGEDGFVRRLEVELDRDGSAFLLEVDVLEVDTDATVEAPPADDVITVEEFVAART